MPRVAALLGLLVLFLLAGCSRSGEAVTGNVLAGTTSPYQDYTPEAYQRALQEGKIVFLEFHATWCSVCREQERHLIAAFNALDDPRIIGFRVNYDRELGLRREFDVPYQHTHVILDQGKNVRFKSSNLLYKDQILAELNKL